MELWPGSENLITLQGSGWTVLIQKLICLLKVYKLDAVIFENYSGSLANDGIRWITQYKGVWPFLKVETGL